VPGIKGSRQPAELRGDDKSVLQQLVARYVNTDDVEHLEDLIKFSVMVIQRKRPNG
jgi:hypothetical protein